MNIKKFLTDDSGVSPVIGVILMVAITVILAAVIASFVLGLGDQADNVQPTASLSFDYDASVNPDNGDGNLTVTHDSGESVLAEDLVTRGDGIAAGDAYNDSFRWDNPPSNEFGTGSEVTSGQSIEFAVLSNYDIDIVWDPEDTSESATLGSDEGPDA